MIKKYYAIVQFEIFSQNRIAIQCKQQHWEKPKKKKKIWRKRFSEILYLTYFENNNAL